MEDQPRLARLSQLSIKTRIETLTGVDEHTPLVMFESAIH